MNTSDSTFYLTTSRLNEIGTFAQTSSRQVLN